MSGGLDEVARVFARIGAVSFGGPAAQIALLHKTAVDERRWLDEREFLAALNLCTLLPGPEATQLAAYIGHRRAGVLGGVIAGTLFVLPGAAVLLGLSVLYARAGALAEVQGVLLGLKAAVLGLVAQALWRIGSRTLRSPAAMLLAAGALVATAVVGVPFPIIVVAAAVLGMVLQSLLRQQETSLLAPAVRPSAPRTLMTLVVVAFIWLAPLVALSAALGPDHVLSQQALVFVKAALVTFGGAYAVLAYFRQQFVDLHGWLTPDAMLAGLSLAETTPGPLILVGQFLAFTAASATHSLGMGVAASAVFLWATFVPAIGLIIALGPWVGWVQTRPRLRSALTGVTCAVVGVIAGLALWLATHTLFAVVRPRGLVALDVPEWATLRPDALLIAVVSCVLLIGLKWGVVRVLLVAVAMGVLAKWLTDR